MRATWHKGQFERLKTEVTGAGLPGASDAETVTLKCPPGPGVSGPKTIAGSAVNGLNGACRGP
jgi:hypothetical protein